MTSEQAAERQAAHENLQRDLVRSLEWAMKFVPFPECADSQSRAEGYEPKYNAARAVLARAKESQ